jgi:hypothetical protein
MPAWTAFLLAFRVLVSRVSGFHLPQQGPAGNHADLTLAQRWTILPSVLKFADFISRPTDTWALPV